MAMSYRVPIFKNFKNQNLKIFIIIRKNGGEHESPCISINVSLSSIDSKITEPFSINIIIYYIILYHV